MNVFKPTTRTHWDWASPLAIICLGLIGIAFIYSAQVPTHGNDWLKQIVWFGFGAAVYVAVSLIDYRFWLSIVHWIYVACIITLILVLVPGIGKMVYGSRRWLFVFQPSETAKIAVLLVAGSILLHDKVGSITQSLGTLGKLALAVGAPMLLILLQPDLKSAIVLPPMVFSMLYVSKLSSRFFAGALAAFLVIVGLVGWDTVRYKDFIEAKGSPAPYVHADKNWSGSWLPLRDYQRNRIVAFLWPDKIDPAGVGWNQRQSLISVGSGGLAGKGWTDGTQAQLGYLPSSVSHNDFVFSVIAEEKGFLGSLLVLGLFAVVLFNGIRIASHARDRLGTLLAVGVTVLFAVHVFVNIAMTIGLMPITGIPLPFISYGGTFMLSCCLLQGLVQSVWRFRKDFA
ncbi:MAG: rod shape-determining protein RodA [Verrucomicrobia bacterium]|nr:rod shape-determining protein RodA [Verrucomicrobiota bacterium]